MFLIVVVVVVAVVVAVVVVIVVVVVVVVLLLVIQSLRAFRRPKLGGLELPGFQDWIRLTCRGAAEDIISESWGFLNECHPHPESLEKHLGAARELSEISWGSLQQLLVIFWRSFT